MDTLTSAAAAASPAADSYAADARALRGGERRALLKSAGALLASSGFGLPGLGVAQAAARAAAPYGSQADAQPGLTAQAQPGAGAAPDTPSAATGASARVVHPPPFHSQMIGFVLSHEQFPVPELVRLGALAEHAGFDLISTSDHFQPWQDNERHAGLAWVTLGALAQSTRALWMGTMVTCPTLRYHPAVVAEAFASLSLLSPGRIYLGVGSGEALNEQAATGQWPKWRERWDRLIEALAIIRGLWSGQPLQYHGRHYQVNALLYDRPAAPIPLLTAANGPKAMRLAGQHGDGLITDPSTWKQYRGEWHAGAQAAGKNPADMPVMTELFVVVGDAGAAQRPAELWRFLPKAFKGYQNIQSPRAIQKRADAEIQIPALLADWVVSTDPLAHVHKIKELFASGVTIVNVHSAQQDQQAVIDFYAQHVLSQLKSRSTTLAAQ
jgi:F420-dependent hydroxymycolic acid dehydrogenase